MDKEMLMQKINDLSENYIEIIRSDWKRRGFIGYTRKYFQPLLLGLTLLSFFSGEFDLFGILAYIVIDIFIYFKRDYLERKNDFVEYGIFASIIFSISYLIVLSKAGVFFSVFILCIFLGAKYLTKIVRNNTPQ